MEAPPSLESAGNAGRSAIYVGVATAVLFALLTVWVATGRATAMDRELILSMGAGSSSLLTGILLAVTFISGKLAAPAALLIAALLYRWHGVRTSLFYIGACVSGQAIDALLKYDIGRVRPHHISPRLTAAGGFSYPSADVMLSVLIFGLGAYLLSREVRSAAVRWYAVGAAAVFAVLAAVARVYLGAHWPSDTAGGALAGVSCAAFWVAALRRWPATSSIVVAPQER